MERSTLGTSLCPLHRVLDETVVADSERDMFVQF